MQTQFSSNISQPRELTVAPDVSILMPNLNYREFLGERFQSIFEQTYQNWELVIVDAHSDDGAWELIQKFAQEDSRIRASQAPRKGIYSGLNHCIELARGRYIYVATSDDSMSPDCLEKMVTALDAHPECEICHCCLTITDENGKEFLHPDSNGRYVQYWRLYPPASFYGELIDTPHIRLAPYDGLLHCALQTIYVSLTQLLIRRSVFEKVGLFRQDWGPMGDFEWGMRASLVCNTIHIPNTLATWRLHPKQLTSNYKMAPSKIWQKYCDMVKAALTILKQSHIQSYRKIRLRRLLSFYRQEQFIAGIEERPHTYSQNHIFLALSLLPPCYCHEVIISTFF